MAPIMHCCMNK